MAGATNLSLLNNSHQPFTAAISNGDTLQDIRKKFDVAVAKYGWSYKGKRGWRTNVIYQNNKNTANAAGRWTQQQRVKGTRPYLLYSTAADTSFGQIISAGTTIYYLLIIHSGTAIIRPMAGTAAAKLFRYLSVISSG